MNARRLFLVSLCVAYGVLGVLMLSAGSALAAFTGYSFVDSFGALGIGAGSFSSVGSVAVDSSSGDVFVLDAGAGSLYKFDAAGVPAEFSALKTDVIEGVGGAGEGLSEVAVSSGGPAKGDIYVANEGALLIYSEAGEKLGELTEQAGTPWGIPCGVAVDATGDVFVGLAGFPGGVNEYSPSANPVSDGDYVSSLSGVPLTCAFAAGSEGDVYGAGYPAFGGPAGVARYAASQFNTGGKTAAGTLVDAVGSTLAVDPLDGDVFVDEQVEEGKGSQVAHYGSAASGSPRLEAFGSVGLPGELAGGSYGVAVNDSTGTVYVSQGTGMVNVFAAKVVPDVITGPAPKLVGEAATLTGTVNPDGTTLTSCQFEYGTTAGSYPNTAECSPGAGSIAGSEPVVVTAKVTGLQRGILYYFRLTAGNSEGVGHGQDRLVDIPPIVEGESTLSVTASSATLQAQVNPAGTSTTYQFEYDTNGYSTSASHGESVPISASEIGSGIVGVPVTVHVQGLAAGTVYHYRVVASNEVQVSTGPDHTFTTQTVSGGLTLPDERQYELVSPPSKHGGEVLGHAGYSSGGIEQASEAGDAITYLSIVPFELDAPADNNGQQYISTHTADGWSTQNITAPVNEGIGAILLPVGTGTEYRAFSSDLSRALNLPFGGYTGERRLSPEQPENFEDLFVWEQGVAGFQPLVTRATPNVHRQAVQFEGGSSDLKHVIFSSEAALTTNSQPVTEESDKNLYEWSAGAFRLVNILPEGRTTTEESGRGARLGSEEGSDTRNAVSNDGSRVIWSYKLGPAEAQGGIADTHVYERDMSTGKSVQVDVPQGGSIVASDEREGSVFEAASADGSKIFFKSDAPLTSDAYTGHGQLGGAPKGNDLYEYDVNARTLVDLTVDPHPTTDRSCSYIHSAVYEFCGANVLGVVGASEDGSYVYFVANGTLAAGVTPGNCRVASNPGKSEAACNLYVTHYDGSSWATRFIARLSGQDEPDWQTDNFSEMTARVSPNGRYVAFVSLASPTGYNNTDVVSGMLDTEVYGYATDSDRLVCVSCNPTGARPIGEPDAASSRIHMDPTLAWGTSVTNSVSGMLPGWTAPGASGVGTIHQPRYLADDGRLFFGSDEALVPQDTNGRDDVYEYEPGEAGSCRSEGGCVYLVSGGTGSSDSVLIDASSSGDDVFFISKDRLVPQDTDNAQDMYDAHSCTGVSPCFATEPLSPPSCTNVDACKPGPTPQPPIFGAPASATFSGPGNPAVAAATPRNIKQGSKSKKAKGKHRTKGKSKRHGKHRRRVRKSGVGKITRGRVGR